MTLSPVACNPPTSTTHGNEPAPLFDSAPALLQAVNEAVNDASETAAHWLQRISELLRQAPQPRSEGHCVPQSPGSREDRTGGLAPRRLHMVTRYISEHLDAPLKSVELADLVGLSVRHFCRAFRRSMGVSPRAYIIHQRLEKAKALMLETDFTLGEIAAESGLSDQAHMCHLFKRFLRTTPGTWRRSQVNVHHVFHANAAFSEALRSANA